MKECYGKAVYYNPDLNKIEKLSEDDRWWCDEWGEGSRFSIKYNKWLKEIIREYEPKLYEFVNSVFGDSYAYTKAYRDFVKSMEGKI